MDDYGTMYYEIIKAYNQRYPNKTYHEKGGATHEGKRDYDSYLMAKLPEVDWLEVRRIQDEWQGRLNWLKMV